METNGERPSPTKEHEARRNSLGPPSSAAAPSKANAKREIFWHWRMATYAFPDFHRYPPYFTLQPVESTREKQAQLWRELIRKYCEWNRKYVLSVDADAESPLFANAEIDRKLDRNARIYFLNEMVRHGEAEAIDKKNTKFLIYWKKPTEWAELVLQWVREN